jgi:KTSC domain
MKTFGLLLPLIIFLGTICSAASSSDQPAIVSHIRREAVASHGLAAIGYSKRLHALEIEFVNGAIYRYLNVPPRLYRDLIVADSKARFYDQNVRGKFLSARVRPRDK